MSQNFAHQEKLFDPKMAEPVTIVGGGSIGSWVALVLTKMGVDDVMVIDHDVVASHNGPMSLYTAADMGLKKVDVLQERIKLLAGVTIKTSSTRYEGGPFRKSTVISCVDRMKVRGCIWEHVEGRYNIDLFIDTRTAKAYAEVFAISPRLEVDKNRYKSRLFSDEEAAVQMCGTHGVAFVSARVAATVGSIVSQYWQTRQKQWWYPMKCDTLENVPT